VRACTWVVLCISVEDVDGEARRLQGLGVELEEPPADHEPWGMRTTYVRDPDGNLVEFLRAAQHYPTARVGVARSPLG
jgi:catechol 2,3-dioxygenase-like lactoylglutathione lyase family enzyme